MTSSHLARTVVLRETARTRDICRELLRESKTDRLIIPGDFKDDFGRDRHEQALQDPVAVMLEGKGESRLLSPTRDLTRDHPDLASYHCRIKPERYRAFVDHIFVTPALGRSLVRVYLVDDPIAAAASDHLPVAAEFRLPARPK